MITITKTLFKHNAGERSADLIGDMYDANQIINSAFDHFRDKGFPYPSQPAHVSMQQINTLARMGMNELRVTSIGSAIPNKYHPHRYAVGIQRGATAARTVVEAYNDDKWLRTSLNKALELAGEIPAGYFSMMNLTTGMQVASNFRPGYSSYMYRRFCSPGAAVLDTSFGFGGRLVGAIASGVVKHYVGFDPSTPSWQGNTAMLKDLQREKFAVLVRSAIEDADRDKFAGKFDFAMTSPPYWVKEHYSDDDEQSFRRYPELRDWVQGFLLPCMQFTSAALKPSAYAVIVIADVKVRTSKAPLVELTKRAAFKSGLSFVGEEFYPIVRRLGKGGIEKPSSERVLLFRKELAADQCLPQRNY